jgi:hypothetical protein
MTNAQDKFFRLLQAWVDDEGLELVVNKTWANTGILMIQEPGSFGTLLKIPFDFQTDRASFGWMAARPGEALPVFAELGRNAQFALFSPEELDEAIRLIMQWSLKQKELTTTSG